MASDVIAPYQSLSNTRIAAAAAFANQYPRLGSTGNSCHQRPAGNGIGCYLSAKIFSAGSSCGWDIRSPGFSGTFTKITTILKSNATFVAGGAYRESALRPQKQVLVSYFQQQETATNSETTLNLDKLGQTCKTFSAKPTTGFSDKQGVGRLLPESPQPEITGGETVVS